MAVFFKRIATLILKQLRNELTDLESDELKQWIEQSAENRRLYNELTNSESLQQQLKEYHDSRQRVSEKIEAGIAEQAIVKSISASRLSLKKMIAAAAVLVVVSTVAWFWLSRPASTTVATTATASPRQLSDIMPGGNRASLTLSDGSVIFLDSVAAGTIAQAGNSRIVKLKNGEIEYQSINGNQSAIVYSTLNTRNGTYRLHLPDGSWVWLNAASSIKYPNNFTGTERVVEITGEAYFEVAHNAVMPFIVKKVNSDVSVRVLGTHFNVNAYNDEDAVKVTLLEGSVKVQSAVGNAESAILKPGQQAVINNKLSVINHADMEEAMAWKNGYFQFNSTDIKTVLRQAARIYDIEVSFPNGVPADKFKGIIPNNLNLDQFLQILSLSEVSYRLEEGRRLVVINKH